MAEAAPSDADLAKGGERFVPGDPNMGLDTQQEHLLRYRATAPLVAGRRVLDAACGEGYGAALLAGTAREVVGLDLSEAAIAHARDKYARAAGLADRLGFVAGSIADLPFPDASFDVVVSFETIEHVDAALQQRFVAEIARVLKPDGLLVMSTPNRVNYSERPGYRNPFHVREMDPAEFRALLAPFVILREYAQSVMAFSAIWRAGETTYPFHGDLHADGNDDTYLIAVCGRPGTPVPETSLAALSYDPGLSYARLRLTLAEKERWIADLSAWGKERDRVVGQRDARIVQLQDEVVRLGAWGTGLDRAVAERQSAIEQLGRDLAAARTAPAPAIAERDARIAQLQQEIVNLGAWGRSGDQRVSERDARIAQLQEEVIRLGEWGRAGDAATVERDARIARLQGEVHSLAEWGQRGDKAVLERELEIAGLREDLRQRGDHVAARERELTETTARMNDLLFEKARLETALRAETAKAEGWEKRLAKVPGWVRRLFGADRE